MADLPYRVDDGVKRAKAAWLLGLPTVRAVLLNRRSEVVRAFDVPIAGLLSRKSFIDLTLPGSRQRWSRIWSGMRRDPSAVTRIELVRASRGTPIEDVVLFPHLVPPPP